MCPGRLLPGFVMNERQSTYFSTPGSRLVPVDEAVGLVIPHDITEIVKGKKKGPAFKKGHVIREKDIEKLKDLGKYHVYCLDFGPEYAHENEAGLMIAKAACGQGVECDLKVTEGKVAFKASRSGLFRVDREKLLEFNLLGDVMLSTRHSNSVVNKGDQVAAGRAIPLVISRKLLDQAETILRDAGGILRVIPWQLKRAAIVVTGREVFEGRIKDAFGPAMSKKLRALGLEVQSLEKVTDDPGLISEAIRRAISRGAELVICTGGMSVDPDDVTRKGIRMAGAQDMTYGTPVLPGAMFLVSYIKTIPVLGIPACGMYFKTTVLDLVLPRILIKERIGRREIAALGHGGLCLSCKKCRYPVCPFGR